MLIAIRKPSETEMFGESKACAFDDVMLDWAMAEVLSPKAWEDWYWPLGEPLRSRCANGALTDHDRTMLVQTVLRVRGPYLIDPNDVTRSSTFWRSNVTADELSRFSIIWQFGYEQMLLGEFAAKIRYHPSSEGERRMQSVILEMLRLESSGQRLNGTPIAVVQGKPLQPLLIEGYKRCMAALWAEKPSIEMYFCRPGGATTE